MRALRSAEMDQALAVHVCFAACGPMHADCCGRMRSHAASGAMRCAIPPHPPTPPRRRVRLWRSYTRTFYECLVTDFYPAAGEGLVRA
jgi:hypothetical protein